MRKRQNTLVQIACYLDGVGLVLGLTVKGKLVLGLAIGNLVNAEPLLGGLEEAGELLLNILNVYSEKKIFFSAFRPILVPLYRSAGRQGGP